MRNTTIQVQCKFCNTVHTLSVKFEDIAKYQGGAYVQDAFPYLNADERELLISGMCGDCWSRIFGDDEE